MLSGARSSRAVIFSLVCNAVERFGARFAAVLEVRAVAKYQAPRRAPLRALLRFARFVNTPLANTYVMGRMRYGSCARPEFNLHDGRRAASERRVDWQLHNKLLILPRRTPPRTYALVIRGAARTGAHGLYGGAEVRRRPRGARWSFFAAGATEGVPSPRRRRRLRWLRRRRAPSGAEGIPPPRRRRCLGCRGRRRRRRNRELRFRQVALREPIEVQLDRGRVLGGLGRAPPSRPRRRPRHVRRHDADRGLVALFLFNA